MLMPIGPRVLLRPIETQRSKLIELTDYKIPTAGVVVAVGKARCPNCDELAPAPCAIGETVIISALDGQDVTMNGERFVVVTFGQVLGKWEPDEQSVPLEA